MDMVNLVLGTQAGREEALRVAGAIAIDQDVTMEVQAGAGGDHIVTLSPDLSKVVLRVLSALGSGGTVSINAMPEELTTTEAARVLGTSRPTLMKLVRNGLLPHVKVGTHTRLRRDDVLGFKAEREAARRGALDELRELEFALDGAEGNEGD